MSKTQAQDPNAPDLTQLVLEAAAQIEEPASRCRSLLPVLSAAPAADFPVLFQAVLEAASAVSEPAVRVDLYRDMMAHQQHHEARARLGESAGRRRPAAG